MTRALTMHPSARVRTLAIRAQERRAPNAATSSERSDASIDASTGYDAASTEEAVLLCAPVLDQYNVRGQDYSVLSNSNGPTSFGQTFTVGVSGRLMAIELRLGQQGSRPDTVTIELFAGPTSLGSVAVPITVGSFGPIESGAASGPGSLDVSPLNLDVAVGEVYYFELTVPNVTDTCVGSFCSLSGSYCDFDSDCAPALQVATEQHAPQNQEDLYLGGMMYLGGAEYGANGYWHDRDLQFKTVVAPFLGSSECSEPSAP